VRRFLFHFVSLCFTLFHFVSLCFGLFGLVFDPEPTHLGSERALPSRAVPTARLTFGFRFSLFPIPILSSFPIFVPAQWWHASGHIETRPASTLQRFNGSTL
jgi:hypothetical protein